MKISTIVFAIVGALPVLAFIAATSNSKKDSVEPTAVGATHSEAPLQALQQTAGASEQATTDKNSFENAWTEQKHSAADCKGIRDTDCLRAWYAEYRAMILEELKYWDRFRRDADSGNQRAAQGDIAAAQEAKQYRHLAWSWYHGLHIAAIPDRQLEAISGICRIAIIGVKYWIAGLATHDNYSQGLRIGVATCVTWRRVERFLDLSDRSVRAYGRLTLQ